MILLLAEDEALIGLNLEDGFRDVGYEVARPFTTCVAAMTWLKSHSPSVALIGYHLQDGPCTDLAHTLRGRGIPFAIYSGSLHGTIPPESQGGALDREARRLQHDPRHHHRHQDGHHDHGGGVVSDAAEELRRALVEAAGAEHGHAAALAAIAMELNAEGHSHLARAFWQVSDQLRAQVIQHLALAASIRATATRTEP